MNKVIEIRLDNKKYFKMFLGKRVLKKNIYNSKGEIPVISANVFDSVGYTEKSVISEFKKDYIIWSIDGNFEFNHIKKGYKFMPTDHCGCLEILDDAILPQYLLFQLEFEKLKYSYDRTLRPSLRSMSSFIIKLPLDSNGKIDVLKQQKLLEKYKILKELRTELILKREELSEVKISILENIKSFKNLKISDILKTQPIPKKITRKDILNKGQYPVYSSQYENLGQIGSLNTFMFFPDEKNIYFTFGDHTKSLYIRTLPFSVLDNVKVLKLNKELIGKIDLDYLIFNWLNLMPSLGYTRHWREARNISIKIPLKSSGDFDFNCQKDISNKHMKVEKIRESILNDMDNLMDLKVDLI